MGRELFIFYHFLFPSKVEPLLFVRGRFFSWLLDQVLPFPFCDVALENPPDGNGPRLMQLIGQFQKPVMISHHIRRLHGIFENFRDRLPHIPGRLIHSLCRLYQVQFHRPNIYDRFIVDPQTLLPQLRPLVLLEIIRLEVRRRDHQQDVVVRVSAAISLRARDLHGADPTPCGKAPELGHADPRPAHPIQGGPELMDLTVPNRQRHEQEARIGVVTQESRQRPVDLRLPHQASSPLTDGAMPDATEPRGLQLQLILFRCQWIMREAENLRAVLHARRVALMSSVRTTRVDLGDIVSLASVLIPRFVTWGHVGEVLPLVDFRIGPWYGDQVSAPPSRHKNPAYLLNSHFVVYGVFCCASRAKCLILQQNHINVIPLKTQGKVGPGGIADDIHTMG